MTDKKDLSRVVPLGLVLVLIAGLAAVFAGFGSRWGWWHFLAGFAILRWAAYGGLVAVVLCLIGFVISVRNRTFYGSALSVIGLLIGAVVAGIPLSWWETAERVPAIHDITTDTENPPRFVTILSLRRNAPNPPGTADPRSPPGSTRHIPTSAPCC